MSKRRKRGFPNEQNCICIPGTRFPNYTRARKVFEAADEALGFSISDMCFNGPEDQLRLTFNTQPAILTASVACAEVLKENGLSCEVAAGHSLGEYSALVLAGALDFADAVRIVRKRGQFMQEAVPVGEGSMAAVLGLESDKIIDICRTVEAECGEAVQAVNFNCPGQVVIAGSVGAVDKALAALKEAGAKRAVLLPVSAPFHSTLMQPASKRLAEVFETITFHDAKIPVVANVTAHDPHGLLFSARISDPSGCYACTLGNLCQPYDRRRRRYFCRSRPRQGPVRFY